MFVKVADNEIQIGPQSSKGSGDGWYWYEGVNPLDAGLNQKVQVSISDDVATGSFVVDSSFADPTEDINRSTRNGLLLESDWTQLPDSPLDTTKKQEWATYRQELRDLDLTVASDSLSWPTQPS